MKITRIAAFLLAATAGMASAAEPKVATPDSRPRVEQIVVENVGLKTPESVLYEPDGDVYLVSNINGDPTAKDGNGFISRISPEGKVIDLRWIAGGKPGVELNAPKGMALVGDRLYVADLDAVRVFDRKTGAPRGSIDVVGAQFLNGIAVGPAGDVFVTDTGVKKGQKGLEPAGGDAIYRIDPAGKVRTLIRGPVLRGPNGIVALQDGSVLVVTFNGNEIYRITPGLRMFPVRTAAAGHLDGLVETPDGSIYVSSWETNTVYRALPGANLEPLVRDVPTPAGIGYDLKRNRVLIPEFQKDRLVFVSGK